MRGEKICVTGIQWEDGILYDLGETTTGKIRITSPEKEEISIQYGPCHDFLMFEILPVERMTNGRVLITHDNVITCRYIKIGFRGKPAKRLPLEFRPELRSVEEAGSFRSDCSLYDAIFRVSARTIHLCMLKHYRGNATYTLQPPENRKFAREWRGTHTDYVLVDGARRDREVWMGDLLPEVRGALLHFGDKEIVKSSLEAILSRRREDGQIPASSISNQTFYEYNCWFAIVLYEYYMISGDRDYAESMMDILLSTMHFITTLMNSDGLIKLPKMQTWAWTLSREGYVTSSHCVIYRACMVTARLCGCFGRQQEERRYLALGKRLKTSINRYAYDVEEKCYRDRCVCGEKRYSLDANCLAILFEVAEPKQRQEILRRMEERFWTPYGSLLLSPKEPLDGQNWVHNNHIWPFAVSMEVEARFFSGDYAGAAELMKRTWGTMLEHGADTFWEIVDASDGSFMKERLVKAEDDRDTYNSEAHGWSAGLPWLMLTYLAGVAAEEPGYRSFTFHPGIYGMTRLDIRFPTICGPAGIKIFRDGNNARVWLQLPEGCQCKTSYPIWEGGKWTEGGFLESEKGYLLQLPEDADEFGKKDIGTGGTI